MGAATGSREREGLSLQTLAIAAIASGIAAVVVSHVWKDGTVLAAAMTPVVVAVVKELLERPMQSEAIRRAASTVSEVATARRAVGGAAAARTESVQRGTATATPPPPPSNGHGEVTPGDVVLTHPRRTYGAPGRRRWRRPHIKVAIVTGLLAFVIAAAAITIPEIVFGGAVSSSHRTTLFGGQSKSTGKNGDEPSGQDQGSPQGSPQPPQGGGGSQPAPGGGDGQQQSQPQQPSQPSEQPPSSGGAPAAPSAPSTPSP